jgi:hypothetical protein
LGAKKILLIVFAVLACGILGLTVLAVILVPRYVEAEVVRAARERGVELVPGEVSFGIGWVQVADARLSLIGVRGLEIRTGLIDSELKGMQPLNFTLNRVEAKAAGEPLALANELASWKRAHGHQLKEPFSVKPLSFTLRARPEDPPLVAIEGAELLAARDRYSGTAKRLRVLDRDLGEARVILTEQQARAALTLGESALDNPLLGIELDMTVASERTVNVALAPIPLTRLGALLRVALPLEGVTASGTLTARIPNNLAAGGRVAGNVDVLLKGYVPPHPVELDGFVFGDTTSVSTHYVVEAEQLRVVLTQSRVRAGRFELAGEGELRAEVQGARLSLILRGQLPCNALASAAAESRLGRALGKVTGKAALQVVSGTVGVHVAVDANTSDLGRARVLKTISPGCGLKPLTIEELVKLGELLPEALDPKVAKDFEELLRKNLPGLIPPPGSPRLTLPDLSTLPLPKFPPPPSPPQKPDPAPRKSKLVNDAGAP